MNKDDIINNLFKELSEQKEIEAIRLGRFRAGTEYDEKSDYDVYLLDERINFYSDWRKINV